MISALLSAALTFTATATGVDKGAPIEFVFADARSDRDYETLFLLDEGIDSLCRRIEAAGIPRGVPAEVSDCRFWPVGCRVRIEPSLDAYLEGQMPAGLPKSPPVYTGGARTKDGRCVAGEVMPASFHALYSLPQSPIVPGGIVNQGEVYGCFTAKTVLRKGERYTFTISCDQPALPTALHLTVSNQTATGVLNSLRTASEKAPVTARVDFDGQLSIREAIAVSKSLAAIDSPQVMINGARGVLFYRAFLPLEKWRDRRERLTQPFELTLHEGTNTLVFIDEDWSVEGLDPKLTPRVISYDEAAKHPQTDTCFIYVNESEPVQRILDQMNALSKARIRNWYVFSSNEP